jgi:hypothetical protein
MLVFIHNKVCTGQKVIKLKLKIGTGFITGMRSRQHSPCADEAKFVIPYLLV